MASATAAQAQRKAAQGDVAGALQDCLDLFDCDPLVEPVALFAMQCLASLVRRLEAVAAYDRLNEALGRELGLRPTSSVQELHLSLLRGST